MKGLNQLAAEIHRNALKKGFAVKDQPRPIYQHAALIMTELAEMVEADRRGVPLNMHGWVGEELADTIIRCLDLAGEYGIDVERELAFKMRRNKDRPYKHGKEY